MKSRYSCPHSEGLKLRLVLTEGVLTGFEEIVCDVVAKRALKKEMTVLYCDSRCLE